MDGIECLCIRFLNLPSPTLMNSPRIASAKIGIAGDDYCATMTNIGETLHRSILHLHVKCFYLHRKTWNADASRRMSDGSNRNYCVFRIRFVGSWLQSENSIRCGSSIVDDAAAIKLSGQWFVRLFGAHQNVIPQFSFASSKSIRSIYFRFENFLLICLFTRRNGTKKIPNHNHNLVRCVCVSTHLSVNLVTWRIFDDAESMENANGKLPIAETIL